MHRNFLATLLIASGVHTSAQIKGFNYGATFENGACRDVNNFRSLFQRAQSLPGASGFSSARLYTTVQCGTANAPTSAIQAAIDTGTNLLLGLWASAGSDTFNNELSALSQAITNYPNLAERVIGISVGSEDLYRASPQGVANQAGVGANAAALTDYIGRVRRTIQGTSLAGKPVGHVDTWTAWVLPENAPVIQAVDWLGHNGFPYFESTKPNSIDQAVDNFNTALGSTESVAGGKPVYVTETGWPHTGPASGQAVASSQNAERYWKSVGCALFGNRNTWWYTLEDANTAQTEIQFGITPVNGGNPVFDLSCANVAPPSSSSSVAPPSSSAVPPPSSSSSAVPPPSSSASSPPPSSSSSSVSQPPPSTSSVVTVTFPSSTLTEPEQTFSILPIDPSSSSSSSLITSSSVVTTMTSVVPSSTSTVVSTTTAVQTGGASGSGDGRAKLALPALIFGAAALL